MQHKANIPCQSPKRGYMKSILLSAIAIVFFAFQCTKNYSGSSCIDKKIARIKTEKKWNPPAEVNEYLYNGKKVYLFSADCCDQFNELYDAECNYICAPTGGITGNGDGKCADFRNSAQHVRLVWKDDR